jgi:hypothetical protein
MTYVEITADYSGNDGRAAGEMDRIAGQYRGHRSDREARSKDALVWQFENPQDARQFGGIMNLGGAISGIQYVTTAD